MELEEKPSLFRLDSPFFPPSMVRVELLLGQQPILRYLRGSRLLGLLQASPRNNKHYINNRNENKPSKNVNMFKELVKELWTP